MIKYKKRIICAGMYRSGSTWLFNVVRHIFLSNQINPQSGYMRNIDSEDKRSVHIIKIHPYQSDIIYGDVVIFTSVRDLRDVASSAVKVKMSGI